MNDVQNYNGWRMLTGEELRLEYEREYAKSSHWAGDAFPSLDLFLEAAKEGEVITLTSEMDAKMSYRSRCRSLDELKRLVNTYRFPRDVDRIVRGFEDGDRIPYPVVLRKKNQLRIFGGNTRLDVAAILGVTPKVLVLDVDSYLDRVKQKYRSNT